MNISETMLAELNASKHMGGIIFISLLMVTGVISNSHVIAIFCKKMKPTNHRTSICVLCLVDMIACIVGMPFELVDLTHQLTFHMTAVCKTVRFVNYFVGVTSALLMLVVTIDRYRIVCHPLNWQISDKMAKLACGLVMLVDVGSSWPVLFLFGHSTIETDHENITGVRCSTDDRFVDTNYQTIFNTVLISMVFVTLVAHIVLYIIICRTLTNHDCGTLKVKMSDPRKSFHSKESGTSVTDIATIKTSDSPSLEARQPGNNFMNKSSRKFASTKYKSESTRNIKNLAKHHQETRRITIILFSIVAIFFISSYPASNTQDLCVYFFR